MPNPLQVLSVTVLTLSLINPAFADDEVFEINNPLGFATSITNANNGDLLLMRGNKLVRSSDGRTLSEPVEMPIGVHGVTRLDDEHLIARSRYTFYVSADDGATWEKRGQIDASATPGGEGEYPGWIGLGVPNYDTLIRTSDGRLFLPVRGAASASRLLARQSSAQATRKGSRGTIEGHGHRPECDYSFCYYSSDKGRTWTKSHGTIVVWKDNGFGGMWPADEPCMIELSDGDLMMFFRTTLGRLYTSRSGPVKTEVPPPFWRPDRRETITGVTGAYWEYALPTPLAAAYTPCRIRRIPSTGDLLIVWNQVTADEIAGSYSRCRMSSAISTDDGATWQHYRTIDRTVLAPAGRVEPQREPGMARAIDFVGEIPGDWGHLDYPNIGFLGDRVVVSWNSTVSGPRLLIAPASWFYQNDKPYQPPADAPKLLVNGKEVPGTWIEDRFLVNLADVAEALGRQVKRNMLATLHQAMTALAVEPVYDRSAVGDPNNPVLKVTVK